MNPTEFDTFLLDLDGVIYLGDKALPHAVESVNRLYDMDKEIRFLTNDPRPQRHSVVTKLRELGIEADEQEITTSGWVTAHYLAKHDISTASVVGSDGLRTELQDEGIDITEDNPEAMVVGADEHTSYSDIRRAARHIDRGATFVGTNADGAFPTPEGPSPGAGSIVRAVEAASDSKPTIVGKPEPIMFEMALGDTSNESNAVVVGDNPSTDILGAHRANLTAILVAESEPSADSARDFEHPELTISSLNHLFDEETTLWSNPGYEWPDEIRPGVGAVVINDSKEVLLVKRDDKEMWAVPTGRVELGETAEEAIAREIKEESGLEVSISNLTGVYSRPNKQVFSYPSGNSVHFITNCFLCIPEGGKLQVDNDEVIGVEFFDPYNLPANILIFQLQWIYDALRTENQPLIR